MNSQIPRAIGSTLLLLGAFAVGGGLHRAFVKGTMSPTSPAFVLALLVGSVLIYGGWRLEKQFDPSTLIPDDEADEDEEEETFDESMSPLGESDLEGRERDDSYEG